MVRQGSWPRNGGIAMIDRRGEVAITDERRGIEMQKGRKGASVTCWACVCVCVRVGVWRRGVSVTKQNANVRQIVPF